MTSLQIEENYRAAVARFQSVTPREIVPGITAVMDITPVQRIITPVRTMPYIRSNRMDRALDDNEIRRYAPSVFAERPWSETSDEYRFLPTINVINALRDNGYNVVKAMQSRSRIEGKGEFTKHILRLRQNQYMSPSNVGDEIPELVLINSHDRTSSYKLMLGIFRLVCTNGMIVASSKIDELSVRHIGGARNLLKQVIDVSCRVIDEAPKVLNQINRFKAISLSPDEQRAFASSSIELLDSAINIKPESLLMARRYDDRGDGSGINNLWKTSNIIQENLIKGGIRGVNSKNRFMRTREVKCVAKNVNINKALWKLTEELAKIKS
jgi:hypothetical protein